MTITHYLAPSAGSKEEAAFFRAQTLGSGCRMAAEPVLRNQLSIKGEKQNPLHLFSQMVTKYMLCFHSFEMLTLLTPNQTQGKLLIVGEPPHTWWLLVL